jgi:hypothetical protein
MCQGDVEGRESSQRPEALFREAHKLIQFVHFVQTSPVFKLIQFVHFVQTSHVFRRGLLKMFLILRNVSAKI